MRGLARTVERLRENVTLTVAITFVVALLVPAMIGTSNVHDAALGRDPGIFQYTAWALSKGQIAYRDFHEVNGPLPHLMHLLFLKFGGADEHTFRVADTITCSIVYVLVGAMAPGFDMAKMRERSARERWATRAAWGLAAWCTFSAHRLAFTWWDLSQREGFYNLFLLPSVALQLAAQGTHARSSRGRWWLFAVSGALAAIPILGKPTCALFPVLLCLAISIDRDAKYSRLRAMIVYGAGVVAGLAVFALISSRWCDLGRWVHFILFDSSRFYVYIMRNTLAGTYAAYGNGPKLNLAGATLVIGALLVWRGPVPSRFWTPIAFLFGALLAYFAQQKGFRYHLYPVVGGTILLWVTALQHLSQRWRALGRRGDGVLLALLASLVMYASVDDLSFAWALRKQPPIGALDPSHPREFYEHYQGGNFFAWDTRRAAKFVSRTTPEESTVQTYGLDPYLLFLSKRLSASPFIYAWDLGDDSILAAGPPPRDADWLRQVFASNRAELLVAFNKPPAAFVFFDNAPPSFKADAESDFIARCKDAGAFLLQGYKMAHAFGTVRVWLRNDLDAVWRSVGSPTEWEP